VKRATLALALVLAGCPIPQPLPDYPPGTITPPRILVDEIAGDGNPIIFVPSDCLSTEPLYPLAARIFDSNPIETVDTRWFVNYDPRFAAYSRTWRENPVPPNAETTNLLREVPPRIGNAQQFFDFEPYQHPPAHDAPWPEHGSPWREPGILRVVELVVSNGFDPEASSTPLPNRKVKPEFETQVHRWVFLTVPESSEHPCPQ